MTTAMEGPAVQAICRTLYFTFLTGDYRNRRASARVHISAATSTTCALFVVVGKAEDRMLPRNALVVD